MSEETRHYIGLTRNGNRLSLAAGPGRPEQFEMGPHEPIDLGEGLWVYPVTQEIADEWAAGPAMTADQIELENRLQSRGKG
jgi:hypothetical protein